MGSSPSSGQAKPPEWPMRCRTADQVPKCFRYVKCPYPQAQTVYGKYGAINYSLVGPPDGEVVVCFHGLNGSRLLFQDFSEYVSRNSGFRVLSFDLYGHGLSNAPRVDLSCCRCRQSSAKSSGSSFCCGRHWAPRGRYDLNFFVEQTDELLRLVGVPDEKVNLLGFSLGGTIAVAFAQRFPERVMRLIAISPSGFIPQVPMSYYLLKATWCCLIPLAPYLLCTCWYKRERFARSLKNEDQDIEEEVIENLWSRFVWQLYWKRGVAGATLAALHRIPWFENGRLFREAGAQRRPVLLIWGERDDLNPPQTVAEEVKSCFSNVQLLVVKHAGHIAICDQPRQVILSILSFLHLPLDVDMATADISPDPLSNPKADPVIDAMNGDAAAAVAGTGGMCEPSGRFAERAEQMPVPMVLGHSGLQATATTVG